MPGTKHLHTLGLLADSSMENERRLPIHPQHLDRIEPEIRACMIVERGYAEDFQIEPEFLASRVGRVADRAEAIAGSDILLLPKPQAADVAEIPEGRVLWGWPHCVQDAQITQTAIDRRLTLIAFEAMNHWTRNGDFSLHVFHQNNELAGYSSVLHALSLTGSNGDYGPRLSAVEIYLRTEDLEPFTPGSTIIDVSCDEGMGFEWAQPTGFDAPMFTVGRSINYYAVDHSPSYLWNAATWEISEALLPFLRTVMEGPAAWARVPTIDRAIEIEAGVIRNDSILSFQHREPEYPHTRTG